MKTISRYIMTLALLITAATGAWATEEYESFDLSSGNTTVNGTHFTITGTSGMNTYGLFLSGESVTVTSLNGENITRVEFIIRLGKDKAENITGTPGTNSCTNGNENGSITDINATSVTLSTENIGYTSVSINQITVYYGNSEPAGPEVTTNAEEGETTFTEATFNMPAFDATADYELVRDMSIKMQAQVGDGTQEQPRYRVKKDGNNKFIPADMEITAVPALFTVIDGIENNKVLTQTQDYIVQIYAIDEQTGQPTGEAMTFATFTFEPGIYAVKAVAAQGSDYDGETALSNTFKLFQGYEVQVAAKEFITYYKDEPLYADTETSADAELYTITSVSADQATLSAAIQTAPSLTPLLIFNNSDQDKTFLLIPANEEPNLQLTVAPEFQGTLTGTTIAASTDAQTNYALNGTAFVFVKDAIEVGPNKAWLSISTGVPSARAITLVFDETTGVRSIDNGQLTIDNWYDLNGRKLQNKPTKKGVYIMNGRKVVIR